MSKAEERAIEAYPPQMEYNSMVAISIGNKIDTNEPKRRLFIQGYEQAEKDYTEYAQLWVDSGEVNIKSFKQFLKDRGYE